MDMGRNFYTKGTNTFLEYNSSSFAFCRVRFCLRWVFVLCSSSSCAFPQNNRRTGILAVDIWLFPIILTFNISIIVTAIAAIVICCARITNYRPFFVSSPYRRWTAATFAANWLYTKRHILWTTVKTKTRRSPIWEIEKRILVWTDNDRWRQITSVCCNRVFPLYRIGTQFSNNKIDLFYWNFTKINKI